MSIRIIKLTPSDSPKYKMTVVLELTDKDDKKTKRTIHFGYSGYKDYPTYYAIDPAKAEMRRDAYIARHSKSNEDWSLSGVFTKGFWSKHILWNLPTTTASLEYVKKKFDLK